MNKTGIGAIITSVILFSGILGFALSIPDAFADPPTKVLICHIPPGNPNNAHTIEVSANAVEAHLAHGDFVIVDEPTQRQCDDLSRSIVAGQI